MKHLVSRRWKTVGRKAALLLFVAATLASASGKKPPKADLSRLVVVGDSLSAGVQNISLEQSQQVHGYASLIAKQAGVPLVLPLIASPGLPNKLELVDPRLHTVTPSAGIIPTVPRVNPNEQPTNVAVPGYTLADALYRRTDPTVTCEPPADPTLPCAASTNVGFWANAVLGYPTPLLTPGPNMTQVERALALKPTTMIAFLGSNDALVSALVGIPQLLTPVPAFETMYKELLDALDTTNVTLIVATIPDVTKIPYFTSAATVAHDNAIPLASLQGLLGISPGDYVRTSALPIIDEIVTHKKPGPLPGPCPSPISALPVPGVPCVLRAADAQTVQRQIIEFNSIIRREADAHEALVVDIYGLVNEIAKKGTKVGKRRLTTEFLGGLFSFDGIHPDNTGYAVVANEFIDTMNKKLKTKIPLVNVEKVFEEDSLAQYVDSSKDNKGLTGIPLVDGLLSSLPLPFLP